LDLQKLILDSQFQSLPLVGLAFAQALEFENYETKGFIGVVQLTSKLRDVRLQFAHIALKKYSLPKELKCFFEHAEEEGLSVFLCGG
jgi:hypothetical protein